MLQRNTMYLEMLLRNRRANELQAALEAKEDIRGSGLRCGTVPAFTDQCLDSRKTSIVAFGCAHAALGVLKVICCCSAGLIPLVEGIKIVTIGALGTPTGRLVI
ncbi:hypothetical protein DVH05_022422 [Phytophthora capsici]|nr:hypothetical protein DVH05_022422 [Phytophthora capsici]